MFCLTLRSRSLVLLSLPCVPSLPAVSPRSVPLRDARVVDPHAPCPQHKPDAPQLEEADASTSVNKFNDLKSSWNQGF